MHSTLSSMADHRFTDLHACTYPASRRRVASSTQQGRTELPDMAGSNHVSTQIASVMSRTLVYIAPCSLCIYLCASTLPAMQQQVTQVLINGMLEHMMQSQLRWQIIA